MSQINPLYVPTELLLKHLYVIVPKMLYFKIQNEFLRLDCNKMY